MTERERERGKGELVRKMRWKAKTKHVKTYKDGVLKVGKEMERQRERVTLP